jgi:RNA-directed DNA polymerase
VSLQTPDSVRRLQRALYVKAKKEPAYRFYLLYDKVYRDDILRHAYQVSRTARGARTPGVDGVTFKDIEAAGQEEWLAGLKRTLQEKTYHPDAVRRVLIPKIGGGERPLGFPTIRDRVVQTAAKLVLEPIFEADFDPSAYGYRPKRSAADAVRAVHEALSDGYTDVVDADLSKYLDAASYCPLVVDNGYNKLGCVSITLIRKPLRRPHRTCRAWSSPRLTRCNTVCREAPSRMVVSSIGR